MTYIKNYLEYLADTELKRANGLHPAFASAHEGWAVLLEEILELSSETRAIEEMHQLVSADVMQDRIGAGWHCLCLRDRDPRRMRGNSGRSHGQEVHRDGGESAVRKGRAFALPFFIRSVSTCGAHERFSDLPGLRTRACTGC